MPTFFPVACVRWCWTDRWTSKAMSTVTARRSHSPAEHPARGRYRTAATFEEFLRDCSAAGQRCAFSEGDPRPSGRCWRRVRAGHLYTVYGRRWTYPEIISDTLARPTSYPQLAELLQQLYETGTATPELADAVTGSEPAPRYGRQAVSGQS